MHAFTVKQVEGTITAEEPLRYTHKLIFKQDLKEIREWGLFTEREGLDCKTVCFFFFLKISKEIGKAWRKSITCAKRATGV